MADPLRYTNEDILSALLESLERSQSWEYAPTTSENRISSVTHVGKRQTPVLILSLANGQDFEIRAKRLSSLAARQGEP